MGTLSRETDDHFFVELTSHSRGTDLSFAITYVLVLQCANKKYKPCPKTSQTLSVVT